jgi:hypothetical protein
MNYLIQHNLTCSSRAGACNAEGTPERSAMERPAPTSPTPDSSAHGMSACVTAGQSVFRELGVSAAAKHKRTHTHQFHRTSKTTQATAHTTPESKTCIARTAGTTQRQAFYSVPHIYSHMRTTNPRILSTQYITLFSSLQCQS